MQLVVNAKCQCKTCNCRGVCEFFTDAVQPVIKVVEATVYDNTDHVTIAYINSLKELLENIYCEYYE